MRYWKQRAEVPAKHILRWMSVPEGTYYKWRSRYGKVNEHNGWIPRDHWLNEWEKQAIIQYHFDHPLEGYRRLTYMMLDADVVAAAPSTVYRVLKRAGLIGRSRKKSSKKGTGFHQPSAAHHHWHIDVSYINMAGTFYYLISVLDGYSRFIVHWEIRERSTEWDVEMVLQRAREKFPHAKPRIISDNGPQFVAREFKHYIRLCGMTHVRTSPYYPQSNGKLERYHRTIKGDCIRPGCPLTLEDARRIVARYVEDYNQRRLHSALGYITPQDKLLGREAAIFAERDRKLEQARERRRRERQQHRAACYTSNAEAEDRALRGRNPSADPGPEAKSGGPTPPTFLSHPTSFLAPCEKSQGVWGTGPPVPENTVFSPLPNS